MASLRKMWSNQLALAAKCPPVEAASTAHLTATEVSSTGLISAAEVGGLEWSRHCYSVPLWQQQPNCLRPFWFTLPLLLCTTQSQ